MGQILNITRDNSVIATKEFTEDSVSVFEYLNHTWEVVDNARSQKITINFDTFFSGNEAWKRDLAKAFVYNSCTEHNGVLSCIKSAGTLKGYLYQLRAIYDQLDNRFPQKLLSELNRNQLIELCMWSNDETFHAFATIKHKCMTLNELRNLRFKVNTAIEEVYLPKVDIVDSYEEVVLKEAEKHVSDIVEWKSGESFGKVPFEVALALLTYCIEIIRSDQTKAVLAWHGYCRELLDLDRQGQKLPQGGITALKVTDDFEHGLIKRATSDRIRNLDILHQELLKQYPEITDVNDLPFKALPCVVGKEGKHFNNGVDISVLSFSKTILVACFLGFTILTGVRQSEAVDMKSDSIFREGRDWKFISPIHKTNYGLDAKRSVSGLVEEFLNILEAIGSQGLGDREDLFSFAYMSLANDIHNPKFYSLSVEGASRYYLHSFYEQFLNQHDKEFRVKCPKITPHAFRHTFIEFAQRRFSGNLMPLFRDHYRHQFGSNFTYAYTEGKLSQNDIKDLGHEWIYELLQQYVIGADELYGHMGNFLTGLVDDFEILNIEDEFEQETALKLLVKNLDVVSYNANPYGACLVLEETESLAKCKDEDGIPQTHTATIDMCAGCRNNCISRNSHVDEIKSQLQIYKHRVEQTSHIPELSAVFAQDFIKQKNALLAMLKQTGETDD